MRADLARIGAFSRSQWAPPAVLGAVAFTAWTIHALSQLPLAQESDYARYLDGARHILSGQGATTASTYPAILDETAPPDAQPFNTQPPLHLLLLAAFMALFGVNDRTGVVFGALAYACFVAASAVLGRRLTRSRWLGCGAGCLIALEPTVLHHSVLAGSDLLGATAAVVAFVLGSAPRASTLTAVGSGLVVAVAQLLRFQGFAFLPALLALHRARTGSWRPAVLALAAFVVVVAAALPASPRTPVFLWIVTGIPSWPDFTIHGAVGPMDLAFVRAHASEVLQKWIFSGRHNYETLVGAMSPFVAGVGLFGLALLASRRRWRLALLYSGMLLVGLVATATLTILASRLYLPLVPFAYVGAVGALMHVRRLGLYWLALALVLVPLTAEVAKGVRDAPSRLAHAAAIASVVAEIERTVPSDSWIATDLPEELAWRTGRASLRLPDDPALISAIRHSRPIDFVLLTSERVPQPNYTRSGAWMLALASGQLPGYEMVWSLNEKTLQAKLFKRGP